MIVCACVLRLRWLFVRGCLWVACLFDWLDVLWVGLVCCTVGLMVR